MFCARVIVIQNLVRVDWRCASWGFNEIKRGDIISVEATSFNGVDVIKGRDVRKMTVTGRTVGFVCLLCCVDFSRECGTEHRSWCKHLTGKWPHMRTKKEFWNLPDSKSNKAVSVLFTRPLLVPRVPASSFLVRVSHWFLNTRFQENIFFGWTATAFHAIVYSWFLFYGL